MFVSLLDRKSTRLNSSHLGISYAVFCLKKKFNPWLCELDTDAGRPMGRSCRRRACVSFYSPQLSEHSRTRATARAPCFFFFNHTAPTEIYPLSLHDSFPT